ncbi:MAG: right-handed parallel beta-helix repeat-containing protein [Bacteroidales bacterium]
MGWIRFFVQPRSAELNYCVINYSKASGVYLNSYGNILISHCRVHSNSKGISTWSYPGELNITQSIIHNNRNSGISCWLSHFIYLNNIVISGNGSTGLALSGFSNIQLADFEISNNGGRGIFTGGDLFNYSSINNGIINNNSGGGVYIDWFDDMAMSNIQIEGNGPALTGGGIYTRGFSNFAGLTVNNNAATNGGGIAFSELTTISNSVFENNNATDNGGGLYCAGSILSANVYNVKIRDNKANNGGGIYLEAQDMYDPYFQISNVEISKNPPGIKVAGCIAK